MGCQGDRHLKDIAGRLDVYLVDLKIVEDDSLEEIGDQFLMLFSSYRSEFIDDVARGREGGCFESELVQIAFEAPG